MNSIRRHPVRVVVALVVAFLAVTSIVLSLKDRTTRGSSSAAIASAGGPAGSNSAAGSAGDVAQGAAAPGFAANAPASGTAPDEGAKSAATASGSGSDPLAGAGTGTQQVVRTAQIAVQVKDVGQAAARIRATATELGGSVSSENSDSGANGGPAQDVLVIRVPEPRLDQAVSAVSGTGKELSRTSSSEDVTGTLADLASREASARASVARIRALMNRATRLSDVVLLEGELSTRESNLEAAEASQRALAGQAAQATLTATLTTTGVPAPKPQPDNGFVAGLRRSWHTVLDSTTVLLTVLGALLPVAVLLLIVGAPAYLLTRRNHRRNPRPVAAQEEKTPVAP